MEYFSVIGGLILLIIAGDKLVEGSVVIAEKLHISKLVIGITVIAFGTSAPELMVGVDAALTNVPEIALGNVVGSNIANVLLVIGIPAIFYPYFCDDSEIRFNLSIMIFSTVIFVILSFFSPLYIWQGIVMLSLMFLFLYYSVWRAKNNIRILKHDIELSERSLEDLDADLTGKMPTFKSIFYILLGLIGLMYGAHILVNGATIIARTIGISEAVIGLTIVAVGTSLPELVTSLMAARNKHGDVALGNIIGSNIFNILAIMGTSSLITPISVPDHFYTIDFPIMVLTSFLLIPIAMNKIKISRLTGGVFFTLYLFYILFLGVQSNLI